MEMNMKSNRLLGACWMLFSVVFCYFTFSLYDVRRKDLILQVAAGDMSAGAMVIMIVEVAFWLTSIAAGTAFLFMKGFKHCIGKPSENSKVF
jgi:TRAP-type mannitol/chloroaromatic compound transport system permease small subunit